MESFWNATEAFGDLLIAKMDVVGLEFTIWFWILLAIGVWLNNMRTWLRMLAKQRRERVRERVARESKHVRKRRTTSRHEFAHFASVAVSKPAARDVVCYRVLGCRLSCCGVGRMLWLSATEFCDKERARTPEEQGGLETVYERF